MLMTTEEAARLMGRDERTVRKMCEDGALRAVKLGRSWLIECGSAVVRGRRRFGGQHARA